MAKPWAKAFYNSAAWQQTRAAYIASQHGLCERCRRAGLIVHHRKPLRPQDMDNPDRTLSFANLELLCHRCHDLEHMRPGQQQRCRFDAAGNILPPSAAQR